MTRLGEAMKDGVSTDISRGAANWLWSERIRMGQPILINIRIAARWIYRWAAANQENWNISVPWGKEITEILLVAASEEGRAQTFDT